MSSTSLAEQLNRRIRALAIFIAAVLAAGAFVALSQHQRTPANGAHFLGLRQLRLDAFNGKARLFLRMSPITPKPGPDHSTDISLSSMRWGASSTTTVGSVSSGAGAGKPTLAPFTVTKVLDKTSPLFFKTAVTGTHTQQATIYVLPPAGQGSKGEALEFVLKTVVVGSDQQHATTTGSAETINLVYQSAFEDYLRNGKVVGTS